MVKKLASSNVALFLFILSLGSIAFLAVSLSLAPGEVRNLSSPFGVARILLVVGVSLIIYVLVKDRRKAVHDQHVLSVFLESAGEGIFAIDRNFTITLWNKSAEEITGHSASDVIGQPLRDVISFHRERDRSEDIVFIEEAMLYGEKRSMSEPMYLTHKNGKDVPVGDSAAPIVDHRGKITGCIVVFRDATSERKQNALRSDFAYASHQLRTPVTKALWALDAALDKKVPERHDLEIAHAAMRSIRRLSNEIVQASEIDQGIIRLKMADISLFNAAEQALHTDRGLDSCLSERDIAVSQDGVPRDMTVYADLRLLRRALQELICNAVLYSKPNGSVDVSAKPSSGQIVIEVEDRGIGIKPNEQALAFSKFFRGANVDTTRIPGAGLGLYIARGYVDLMGGKMWFSSKEREGTSFFISLPISGKDT